MARKLFPSYGSALANYFLVTLKRKQIVATFVADYVTGQERRGILGDQSRDREFAETIGREILLAMVQRVHKDLPRFFRKKGFAALRADEKEAANAFSRELMGTLARAGRWSEEDYGRFERDLLLYSERPAQATKRKLPQQASEQIEPPFVERVAFLLDASMLDQARPAAMKLYAEVAALTKKALKEYLRL